MRDHDLALLQYACEQSHSVAFNLVHKEVMSNPKKKDYEAAYHFLMRAMWEASEAIKELRDNEKENLNVQD